MVNFFHLSFDPKECASFHCDKHCLKLIIELVMVMFSAHKINGDGKKGEKWQKESPNTKGIIYGKYFNKNHFLDHPVCIWARSCAGNYEHTSKVAEELCKEYTRRFKKTHLHESTIKWLSKNPPSFHSTVRKANPLHVSSTVFADEDLPKNLSPIPLCMPSKYHHKNAVTSYRQYVNGEKTYFARWNHSPTPDWFIPQPERLPFTITELREELRERKEEVSGTKVKLLERLDKCLEKKRAVGGNLNDEEKELTARVETTKDDLERLKQKITPKQWIRKKRKINGNSMINKKKTSRPAKKAKLKT